MTEKAVYIWCKVCGRWFSTTKDTFTGCCPACGTSVSAMKCMRCGYEWEPKKGRMIIPKRCANPSCRSPYYNRKRVR